MIFTLTHLNVVFFTRVCECLGKLGLTNWRVQPFFLFQKWHHLSSGWPETRHNSTTWLNYFRMGEFTNQTCVKTARHPNAEAFLPCSFAAAASDPCTCAECLIHGRVYGTRERAWLFCRDPVTVLAAPCPLSCLPGSAKCSV